MKIYLLINVLSFGFLKCPTSGQNPIHIMSNFILVVYFIFHSFSCSMIAEITFIKLINIQLSTLSQVFVDTSILEFNMKLNVNIFTQVIYLNRKTFK